MQASAVPNAQRQSISEDLETWAAAEKNNHSVAAGTGARILYVNTDFQKISGDTKAKNQAVMILVKKILEEAAFFAKTQDEFKHIIIAQKLSSLEKFIATGKLGNLKDEWGKLIEANDPVLKDQKNLEKKRKQFIDKISEFLPTGLVLSEKSGAVSSMTHILRSELLPSLKEEIISSCEQGSETKMIGGQPVDSRFANDASRSSIIYKPKENNLLNSEEKSTPSTKLQHRSGAEHIEQMNSIFDGDVKMIETVSKIINQTLLRRVSDSLRKEIYKDPDSPNSVIFRNSREKGSLSNEFTVRLNENDDVIVDAIQMEKYESIVIPPDHMEEWKINRDPLWEGVASQTNFGLRTVCSVRLRKEDLQNNVINPIFDVLPSMSICVKME
jgi:hypothetical protein